MYLNVDLSWVDTRGIVVYVGHTGERLFRQWQESGSDEDFESLCDWIGDEVREQMEIEIENISEQIVSKHV